MISSPFSFIFSGFLFCSSVILVSVKEIEDETIGGGMKSSAFDELLKVGREVSWDCQQGLEKD